MLRGLENSPMLSGYSDSPAPPDSIPDNSVPGELLEPLDLIMDPFADVPMKGPRGGGAFLDLLSEAYSPENCLTTLQEFLNDPNLLEGVNI